MADADIILEKNWTNVIRNLHLGSRDGDRSDLKMFDDSGTNRVHLTATETKDNSAGVSIEGGAGVIDLGNDSTAGILQLQSPGSDDPPVEMTASPKLSLSDGDQSASLSERDLFIHLISTDILTVADDLSAQNGRIQNMDVGGQDPGEGYNKAGVLTALDDQNTETVKIDGQQGTIKHSGGVSKLSDARVKGQIQPVDGALDTVGQLDGVHYEWDDEGVEDLNLDENRHVGFLAQDVREALPEAVSEDESGRLGTIDEAFTPVLVEAIKEQQSLVEEQSEQLDEQERTIDEQQARLDAQETRLEDQRDRISKLESRLDDLESAS